MQEVWFWQCIVSPHMAGLAVALARLGCKVTYVAERAMSDDRAKQGWTLPDLPRVALFYAPTREAVQDLVRQAPVDAQHICQGIRSNGLIAFAQRLLAARGIRQWVVMETVNEAVWYAPLKFVEYARIFRARAASLQGVFATGYRTAAWVTAAGMPADRVFPFAYFLSDVSRPVARGLRDSKAYRFIYVGRLVSLKRVDWLVNALAGLTEHAFELWIVGSGPEESALRALAARRLAGRERWIGQLPLPEVPSVMSRVDCLVLPSLHDGWGAVASEALMAGTPVICSDACGVAGAVRASGVGGVFPVKDRSALAHLLAVQLSRGSLNDRARGELAAWATCLGAEAGARYLLEILDFKETGLGHRPVAPWLKVNRKCAD